MQSPDVSSRLAESASSISAATPHISIRPAGGWARIDLRALWAYRELLYFLTRRDIKLRYKQTMIGSAWVIAQPLLTMIVFTIVFGNLARISSDGIPYSLFVYSGLLPWIFFSNSINRGTQSLVASANLITKVYFPRLIIPCSAIVAGLLDFMIGFTCLAALMLHYRIRPTAGLLMLPVVILLITLCVLAIGVLLSAVNVRYRDVSFIIPFAVQLLMFATPIIYPSGMVPARWKWVITLNPLAGLVEAFRAALFGFPFNLQSLAVSAIFSIALLLAGVVYFNHVEKTFADIV
jgi:lipopolysaccharide transport system permease protein